MRNKDGNGFRMENFAWLESPEYIYLIHTYIYIPKSYRKEIGNGKVLKKSRYN